MENSKVRDLAIKRHDIDAGFFQDVYSDIITANKGYPFRYGRELVLQDLKDIITRLPFKAKILDIGSGTGHLTKWMASMGHDVTGLEPSANMLKLARNNFPEIRFMEGISSSLPFENDTFDLVIAFEVFRYLDKGENQKTFTEVNRVIKKGGIFFFTQVNRYASDFYWPFYYIKKLRYAVSKKTYHYCFFTTSGQQEKLLKRAGFSSVETSGRMLASIRFAYKFGKRFGDWYVRIMEKLYGKQKFRRQPLKSMAGHLVVTATK